MKSKNEAFITNKDYAFYIQKPEFEKWGKKYNKSKKFKKILF